MSGIKTATVRQILIPINTLFYKRLFINLLYENLTCGLALKPWHGMGCTEPYRKSIGVEFRRKCKTSPQRAAVKQAFFREESSAIPLLKEMLHVLLWPHVCTQYTLWKTEWHQKHLTNQAMCWLVKCFWQIFVYFLSNSIINHEEKTLQSIFYSNFQRYWFFLLALDQWYWSPWSPISWWHPVDFSLHDDNLKNFIYRKLL